ncbi:serine hydrolase [Spirosoma areae]
MKNRLLLLILVWIVFALPSLAQTETFNYKRALSGSGKTLSASIQSINRTTGEVVFGGTDTKGPTTPGLTFTWIWGDGTSNNGFFPQTKKYADVTKNYTASVISNYSATEKDTVEVLVGFVKPVIKPIALDPKLKVSIPSQPLSISSSNGYGVPALKPFADNFFSELSRSDFEYLFHLGATIEYDFVNENVLLSNGKFEQYALRDTTFGGAYALWYSRPVVFGIGNGFIQGSDSDFSSMYHEMGHNLTLNFPANFIYGGKIDGPANAFYSEAMAQIFQYAVGYEIINNYQKYGLDEQLLFKFKNLFFNGVARLRGTYIDYVNEGMRFQTFNTTDARRNRDVFQSFLSVPYKFYTYAEQQGQGYRQPIKRLTQFLSRFTADWQKRYDQFNDTPAGNSFRATMIVAAMSYAFEKDLRADFRAINYPISDADWAYLNPLPGSAGAAPLHSFAFLKASNPTLTTDVSVSIASGYTLVTLPTGTSLTALKASFTTVSGATATVNGVNQSSGLSVNDFSKPVVYQVSSGSSATPTSYTIETSVQVDLATVENAVKAFMTKYNVPGLSVAITKDERLVYAKGYGFADKDKGLPVTTNSMFRVASVSKAITGIAAMKLVDDGKLDLDQKVFGVGNVLGTTYGSQPYTPQMGQITMRHLLTHTAGGDAWSHKWNLATNRIDPFYQKEWLDYTQAQVISATIDTRPVTETPGTKGVYSNVGVNIAGRVIEKIAGVGYEKYVQDNILTPLGISPETMRIGGSKLTERFPNEVVYYHPYPGYDQPYDFPVPRLDAHGGWVTTPANLAWLMVHVDGGLQQKDILTTKSQRDMVKPIPVSVPSGGYAGFAAGWSASVNDAFWKDGGMAGSASYWLKIGTYSFAILINTRDASDQYYADIDKLCYQMSDNLTLNTYMKGDQFGLFFNVPEPTTTCSLTANLTATSATFCQGNSVTLTASAVGSLSALSSNWQRDGVAIGITTGSLSVSLPGTYQVTVTDTKGCVGTSASFSLTQKPNPIAQITGVSVLLNGTASLSASSGPGWAHQWSLNETALTGATSSTYTVQQTGSYKIAVTNEGCTGISPGLVVNVAPVPGSGRVATEPVGGLAALTVSPNPSSGQILIRLQLAEPAPATLYITNLLGRELRQWRLPANQTDHEQQADLRVLPTGIYFIVAEANGKRMLKKWLKE